MHLDEKTIVIGVRTSLRVGRVGLQEIKYRNGLIINHNWTHMGDDYSDTFTSVIYIRSISVMCHTNYFDNESISIIIIIILRN